MSIEFEDSGVSAPGSLYARDHSADQLLVGPDDEREPTLSIVLPTLNEQQGILECIKRIKNALVELDITGEIIVSDSSDDLTPLYAKWAGARVIHSGKPGYGSAYQSAFEHARGEYIAMGDADCTYDFEELPRLFRRIVDDPMLQANDLSEPADLVIGSRFDGEIKPGSMPRLHKWVGNPLLTQFLNAFYGAGVTDAHSGFRIIRRDLLEDLELSSEGMEFASEMVMEAAARDLDIAEVPITYHPRVGDATLDSFSDGWRHVKFMLLNAPGYLFSIPGVVSGLFGVALMGLALADVNVAVTPGRSVNFGVRTMVAGSLLTMIGFQVASLGMFATVASNPIRRPEDPVTTFIEERIRLEHGVVSGVVVFGFGALYASVILIEWLASGYESLPPITHDIVAFTAIVIGVQMVFGSFFLSAVSDRW